MAMPKPLRGRTLADFDPDPDAAALAVTGEFVAAALNWFRQPDLTEPAGPVLFLTSERKGERVSAGNGKTLLACAALEALAAGGVLRLYQHERTGEQWPSLAFISAPDLISAIRSCYAPQSGRTVDEVIGRYLSPDVLVLDDIGTESGSDDATMRLFTLLDKRRKATVFTSNYSTKMLRDRSPEWVKLVSRMFERGKGAILTGPDRRKPATDPWQAWKDTPREGGA